jgi:hypothetical protein
MARQSVWVGPRSRRLTASDRSWRRIAAPSSAPTAAHGQPGSSCGASAAAATTHQACVLWDSSRRLGAEPPGSRAPLALHPVHADVGPIARHRTGSLLPAALTAHELALCPQRAAPGGAPGARGIWVWAGARERERTTLAREVAVAIGACRAALVILRQTVLCGVERPSGIMDSPRACRRLGAAGNRTGWAGSGTQDILIWMVGLVPATVSRPPGRYGALMICRHRRSAIPAATPVAAAGR